MPWSTAASTALRIEHVADRLLEARRDVGDRHRLAGALAGLDPAGDRGLEAGEREVEAVPLEVARARSARAGSRSSTLTPSRAARSMCGPPGNGSPSSRATLSKASPAASSMVAPSGSTPRGDVARPAAGWSGRR